MEKNMLKLGCHVGMSGKEMLLGSVKEAISYGANTFMVYTGAPQNTRRKPIEELKIEEGLSLAKQYGISEFIIHAPYLINLANTEKEETFSLAVEFLAKEIERSVAMQAMTIVLHPGSHVGAGEQAGIAKIIEGLNQVLTKDIPITVALETMSGKGSELGKRFEELATIYDGVIFNEKLRVCFDTCHTHDAGYDIIHDFDGVMERFDRLIGKKQIAVFHINDSKNVCGAAKDRHENLGFGEIGFEALNYIVHHKDFLDVPKILETPYIIASKEAKQKTLPPYLQEIRMLKEGIFHPDLLEEIRKHQ